MAYEQDDLEIEFDADDEKSVNIGRNEDCDFVIGHSKISGHHCKLTPQHVFDYSSFGTYLLLKNVDQATSLSGSDFVPYNKNYFYINVLSYDLEI